MPDRPKRQPLPVVAWMAERDDGPSYWDTCAEADAYCADNIMPVPLADHTEAQACIDFLANLLDQSEAVRKAQSATIEVLTKQLEAHQAGQSTPEHAAVGRGLCGLPAGALRHDKGTHE